MKPLLALIALGTILGAAGAGVVVGQAAAPKPPLSLTGLVEQRIDEITQRVADAHHDHVLDFSQAHALDRELAEVRGREHRLKFHDHGALSNADADSVKSELDGLADALRWNAETKHAEAGAPVGPA